MRRIAALLLALSLSAPALAHDYSAGGLRIDHPSMPQPARAGGTAAGFLRITNSGAAADRLIGVEAAIAQRSEIHATEHGADGVARMVHVPAVEIPAGGTVALERGGLHVMFMGLHARPELGARVPAVLVFEQAGRVAVEFAVEAASGGGHDAHAGHAAQGSHGPMSVPQGDDAARIEALLKAEFDRPEAPLAVAPIVVRGDVAVAGWSQDGQGGRAFLRRDAEGWYVELCAGPELVQPGFLAALGLAPHEAERLAAEVNGAEAGLGASLIARLNGFEGVVRIGRQGGHAPSHGAGHGH